MALLTDLCNSFYLKSKLPALSVRESCPQFPSGHEYLNKLFSRISIPLRQPTERQRMLKELALIVTLLALFTDARRRPQRLKDPEDDFMQQQLNNPVEDVVVRGPSHNNRLSANLKGIVALVVLIIIHVY